MGGGTVSGGGPVQVPSTTISVIEGYKSCRPAPDFFPKNRRRWSTARKSCWINKCERIVESVGISIVILRVARILNEWVGRQERPQYRVLYTPIHVIESHGLTEPGLKRVPLRLNPAIVFRSAVVGTPDQVAGLRRCPNDVKLSFTSEAPEFDAMADTLPW